MTELGALAALTAGFINVTMDHLTASYHLF